MPTVISTFAGCGGSSLGYRMAGYRELLAVEWDDNAVETFRLNFPEVPVYHGDIGKLTGKECMRLAGVARGELDVFDGSPPCQGFSTAGKRRYDDPRNSLFKEYARLLSELQPRAFVMENVTGMIKGHMRQAYLAIMETLRGCGYKAKGAVMNAMYFGVPQSRERVIIIGVREDLGKEPSHPRPQTKPPVVKDSIGCLPIGVAGNNEPQVINAWRKARPGQSLRKAVRYVGSFQSVRLNPFAPAPTQIKSHFHWHYLVPRHLTVMEAAVIQGFPAGFVWHGTKSSAKERIGNSVPPLLMKAIAEHIKEKILVGKQCK
jgi:DNA (cytosine-5)-methyltransferase 1